MAMKISFTFIAVLAEVSINSKPFSSAYCFASSYSTTRLFDKSALFPAKAMTMFGEALEKKLLFWRKRFGTELTCNSLVFEAL